MVDIELSETQTRTLLHIPGTFVKPETEAAAENQENNTAYAELKKSKIGSDLFNMRGTQTLNANKKEKSHLFVGYTTQTAEANSSNWEIADARNQKDLTESQKQEMKYLKSIEDIMSENLKTPDCLFDAEQLASHISIVTTQSGTQPDRSGGGAGVSMSNSSRGTRRRAKGSNVQASSGAQEKSEMSSSIGGTMNKTSTNQFTTDTGAQGDFGNVRAKDIQYADEEVPDSMMKAIKIIERLLTQTECHEAHVLYKDYPKADLKKVAVEDEEEKDGKKDRRFGAKAAEEEKKEVVEEIEEDEEGDKVDLKFLFKFRCDMTDGRQVSCIDINSQNRDLIAVSYGENDIILSQARNLKKGILAFWTLKNPKFPEKFYEWDYCITSCAFSKKNPHLIAIGDSQGNVAIFNIRADDKTPIASTKDLDNKHTSIVWEVQWVDRESKPEALVSIAGDGRIIEWSMKRGLDMIELKALKRETNPSQQEVFSSANAEEKDKKGRMTFIETGGMAIDFPVAEKGQTYFCATEDCSVHFCNVNYPD